MSRDLPAFRDYIRERRAALAGFMEAGAELTLDNAVLLVRPRNEIYVRYLNDHRETIAELASEFFGKAIIVRVEEVPAEAGASSADGANHTRNEKRREKVLSKVSYAIAYARKGIKVFPLHEIESDRECSCGKLGCSSAGKHPRLKDWQTLATLDEGQIANWWRECPNANIGVKCGAESGITVLDVDGDEGRDTLRALELEHGELPVTPIAITGSGGAHYYFAYEEGLQNAVRFAKGLDVRTEGGLVVGVGSATKRPYEWEAAFTIGDVQPAKMPEWLVEKIKAGGNSRRDGQSTRIPNEKIHAGEGRNNFLYIQGRSLRLRNFPAEAIRAALAELNRIQCSPPVDAQEFESILHSVLHQPDREGFAEKGDSSAGGQEQPAEWPDPISLDVAQLPELPKGLFAPWAEAMIDAVANATETPRELGAMMMLGTLAAVTQHKCVVQVRPGYAEPLNIWPIVPLEPGNRKTSVLLLMAAPLRQWEREQIASLAQKIAEAESTRATAEARIAVLRSQAARAEGSADYADRSAEIAELEAALPEVPKIRRLWAQDVTPEALGMLMSENGEAIALISDEGGIFDILAGRYSNGVPNLDLFLQAHAGAPVRVDRGSRTPVMMDSPALTIVLSPQPDLLHGLAQKPGFRGRGLLARFLFLLPGSRLGYRSGNTSPVPQAVLSDYAGHVRALLQLERPESGPHYIRVSPDALAEWSEFSATVETWMRDGGRFENLRDWGGKLPGAAARIAGLFHCAEHALQMPHLELSLETMRRALEFAAILSDHALAAFDMMGADVTLKDARKVWNWIQRERKPKFTFRDCFNALRGTFPRTADLERPIEVLVERSFIAPIESPTRAGRPTRLYEVNPKLGAGWQV